MKEAHEPSFTPEQEVLLWAIRVDHTKDQRIAEILEKGVDWTYIRHTAMQHGIIPLLYRRLTEEMATLVPSDEMTSMRKLFMENAANNLHMTQELLNILDLLGDAGVEAMPFKGSALAVQAYGDLSMRSFGDLDILIHEADFYMTYKTLTENRFIPNYPVDNRTKRKLAIFKGEFHFSNRDINLDVHWQLNQRWVSVAWLSDNVWDNTVTISLNARDIRTISPEYSVILICVHGTKHFWQELKWLGDLSQVITRSKDLQWQGVINSAQKVNVKRILLLGLSLGSKYCGVRYPSEINALLKSEKGLPSLVYDVQTNFFRFRNWPLFSVPLFNNLKTLERAKDQVSYVFYTISDVFLLPTKNDFSVVSFPEILFPLYFIVRFFRLIITITPQVICSIME